MPNDFLELATHLAQHQPVTHERQRSSSPLDHLEQMTGIFQDAYIHFVSLSKTEKPLPREGEWLLDNFYLVQQAIRQVRQDMPPGYYRRLPKLTASPLAGAPRVYAIACEIVRHTSGRVDVKDLIGFIDAYQDATPLTMGELWAVPTMLRLATLALLAQVMTGVLEQELDPSTRFDCLADDLAADVIVGHCITGLRELAAEDWKAFFERVSRVERALRAEPADVHRRMDFETRNRYRNVIEELAQTVKQDEESIARTAVDLAAAHFDPDESGLDELPRAAHVGYYLIDDGRAELEASLQYEPSLGTRIVRWLLGHPTPLYLGAIGLLTAAILLVLSGYAWAAGGSAVQIAATAVLGLIPASAVAINLVNWFVTRTVPTRVLPKLDLSDGIPKECPTVVVVPALISSADEIEFLLRQIELHYLGNADPRLCFALLTDFADAPERHMPEDDELIQQARQGIQALNHKHARKGQRPFYFFHRQRQWNSAENCWMAWERKRGKLVEFNRLLQGDAETSFVVQVGGLVALRRTRYVITLDADTLLPHGAARRLVATLAHPLNRAVFDDGQVTAGYTVLQPRVEVKPTSAVRSIFARAFCGDVSLDLYSRAVSNVYQDLFEEGIFVGKGIYDLTAFQRSLEGRVPDNALLSHDLFEGIHGRAGLVSDVTLYEDYPPGYLAYVYRLHRWVRGDWQLLPWLLPRVPCADGGTIANELSILDRWKIVDNLGRSLNTPALLALLVAGWIGLPGSPIVWTLATLLISAAPLVIDLATALISQVRGELGVTVPTASVIRWLLSVVFLPHQALALLDAIATTLARVFVTHRRLLQWTTAAHSLRLLRQERRVRVAWRQMGAAVLMSAAIGALVALFAPRALVAALPLLLGWLAAPVVAMRVSRPISRTLEPLPPGRQRQLRRLARRTWLFFERFVGPNDHWLPPDHFQEDPRGVAACRTSPTNIGLMYTSILSAYEMGYIGPMDLVLRLRAAFDTTDKLEHHRGHLLNWYDTRSLEPLPPRYVSTVDSGNLAGFLIALRQGLDTISQRPVMLWERWQGLLDTLDVLAEAARGAPAVAAAPLLEHVESARQRIIAERDRPERWPGLLVDVTEEDWKELNRLVRALIGTGTDVLDMATLSSLRRWIDRVQHHLTSWGRELDVLTPWVVRVERAPALMAQAADDSPIAQAWRDLRDALPIAPHLDQIPAVCHAAQAHAARLVDLLEEANAGEAEGSKSAHAWCRGLADDLMAAGMAARTLMIGLRDLAQRALDEVEGMDFRFLYDHRRHVFYLGYDVSAGQIDRGHYDLLASEARTASLVAIAKGDAPQCHWLHLARPQTLVDGTRVLLSWNGSMFEYLMPALLMRSFEGTLLHQTCHAVVRRQIDHGRRHGVAWGVSESGYYRFDAHMNYQYRGFGVPGLGQKRGLEEDLVIAPYASLLALSIDPRAVVENLDRLEAEGMLGEFGLYEALDYTRSRLPLGQERATVRSYMAHHQGMIMVALVNHLADNVIVRHFHSDRRVQTVELLLQEQVPRHEPVPDLPKLAERDARPGEKERVLEPWHPSIDALAPSVHVLSNGRISTLITAAGGGYTTWQGVDLTRWRADTTLDDWGSWIYVLDRDSGAFWSAGRQPTGAHVEEAEVTFLPHKVEFHRRENAISLHTEIAVATEDDVEVRRVTLTNHSGRPRRLSLVSYSEIVLAPQVNDRRHPAFNKLFIESEYVDELNALLFRRRPRAAGEEPLYVAHAFVLPDDVHPTGIYETDRARFIGRGRTPRAPAALVENGPDLSGTTGATLDPIACLAQEIDLAPHATVELALVTLPARTRSEALDLVRHYQSLRAVEEAFDQARSQSETELGNQEITSSDVRHFQELFSVLQYPCFALRADPETLSANQQGQSALWPYAISGDYPILLISIDKEEDLSLVHQALKAHAYWRNRQLKVDLVILNERDVGYAQELQERLQQLVVRTGGDAWLNRRGGIFVLRGGDMGQADRVLLRAVARAVLDARKGSLSEQLQPLYHQPIHLPPLTPTRPDPQHFEPTPALERPVGLAFDNGFGGFGKDGREYVIYVDPSAGPGGPPRQTPAPWINVIANPEFGFLVSEAGSSMTWAANSGENRLTPWQNDPVGDRPGEALYLRDEETGHVWSPTPLPAPAPAPYLIRHGAGYTTFEHHSHGLEQRLRMFATPDAPVKVIELRLENTWERVRRITATFYVEWVLGTNRDTAAQTIVPEYDPEAHALLARNPYSAEFGARVAFVSCDVEPHGLTADRAEFLGREGDLAHPAALDRIGLAGTVEAGRDPCAALQVHVHLDPGESHTVRFLLGQGADRDRALELVRQFHQVDEIEAAWAGVGKLWERILGAVTVETPDAALDVLLNRWLLYQNLVCRIWARSALYQSSGAYGYRDQLQDVAAVLHAAPDVARAHILRAARHQFEAGDVLHWWHPPSGRGVRTRITDDLLWLPYITAEYVRTTGDPSILDERVPFRTGEPLEEDEHERYAEYGLGDEEATVYEHCQRALATGSTKGRHGLPLIGGGDWNDGMDRVGIEGRGESIWLGWFLHATLTAFAPLCEGRGDADQAEAYRHQAEALRQALEDHGWDGDWYRRAYYDDGTPLGSAQNRECQIDSLAQSWAVLSEAGDPERARRALEAVDERLVRPDERLILLFTPPFDETPHDPGYIKGYPPGIRENGGQYTHAALWAVWAFTRLGQGDRASALFRLLNPVHHAGTRKAAAHYRVEPYVVAADVYGAPPHTGHGGWTWYTGSSGWMLRLGLEAILGLRRRGDRIEIDPVIPHDWPGYTIRYRYHDAIYDIRVENPDGVEHGVRQVTVDGEEQPDSVIPLAADGREHAVVVRMG